MLLLWQWCAAMSQCVYFQHMELCMCVSFVIRPQPLSLNRVVAIDGGPVLIRNLCISNSTNTYLEICACDNLNNKCKSWSIHAFKRINLYVLVQQLANRWLPLVALRSGPTTAPTICIILPDASQMHPRCLPGCLPAQNRTGCHELWGPWWSWCMELPCQLSTTGHTVLSRPRTGSVRFSIMEA